MGILDEKADPRPDPRPDPQPGGRAAVAPIADRHRREMVWHDLTPRLLTVTGVRSLTPGMVRITLGGPDLDGFFYQAPDDHVKLFFPEPGAELPVMPTLGEDGLIPPPAGSPEPIFRDYTVRYLRPRQRELDIDFALHGHGPGASWAAQARPGQRLGVLGPRGSMIVPFDFDWYLFGADETALPALGAWLARVPAGIAAHAVVEVNDTAEQQPLSSPGKLTVDWVHRRGADAREPDSIAGSPLEQGIRRFTPPAGDGFVWIAGEATALKPIRRHVRGFGLPKDWIEVDGYWRRGAVNHDHHED